MVYNEYQPFTVLLSFLPYLGYFVISQLYDVEKTAVLGKTHRLTSLGTISRAPAWLLTRTVVRDS